MLLDQRRLDFAYEQIVQDAAKARGASTVMIFVAPNCDAMCACRILSYMLRADAVSYKIKPVAGYGDIAAANDELIKVRSLDDETGIHPVLILGDTGFRCFYSWMRQALPFRIDTSQVHPTHSHVLVIIKVGIDPGTLGRA